MGFPENLRAIRKARGLSIMKLSELIGLSTTTQVFAWEHDKYGPTLYSFLRLCEALDCTPNELSGWGEK